MGRLQGYLNVFEFASLESMAVLGKIFRVHAKFFQRDWRAHANFGVHNLSNLPHAACSSLHICPLGVQEMMETSLSEAVRKVLT